MRIHPSTRPAVRRAFTLIEMTAALAFAMMIAGATLILMSNHLNFVRLISSFDFLRDEAPQINVLMVKLLNHADSYRIYTSKASAMSESGAVNTGGRCVRLIYRNPDGPAEERIVAFEEVDGAGRLNFYAKGAGWSDTPEWTISASVTDVTFSDDTGVLLVKLTGPNQESITYVGGAE